MKTPTSKLAAGLQDSRLRGMNEADAIQLFQRCAGIFEAKRSLTIAAVAARLDCSTCFIRRNLDAFPNAFRLPGGDIRIPARDVVALELERKINRETPPPSSGRGNHPAAAAV